MYRHALPNLGVRLCISLRNLRSTANQNDSSFRISSSDEANKQGQRGSANGGMFGGAVDTGAGSPSCYRYPPRATLLLCSRCTRGTGCAAVRERWIFHIALAPHLVQATTRRDKQGDATATSRQQRDEHAAGRREGRSSRHPLVAGVRAAERV